MSDINQKLEQMFQKLQNEKKNTTESLMKWMNDAGIIDQTEQSKKKVVEAFKDVKDKANVTFADFKKILSKMAAEGQSNIDDWLKKLSSAGNTFMAGLGDLVAKASQGMCSRNPKA